MKAKAESENPTGFNPEDFFEADISKVDYENQRKFFNIIRDQFTELNKKEDSLPKNVFREEYLQSISDIIEMAAGGSVPVQDYLCYMYKKGVEGVVPTDLMRAHEWGIIAVSNGSKLASERLRLFYEPLFDYILRQEGALENILGKNGLDENTVTDFVAQNYSILLLEEMKINLLSVAKKGITEPGNFVKFQYDVEQANKKVFPRLLELIA